MKSKIKTIILLLLGVFLFSAAVLAAGVTRFLFEAPGEIYTPGTAKNSAGLLPQVSGVPFSVTVYSVNDSSWFTVGTNETTTLSATQASVYLPKGYATPGSTFTLNDSVGTTSSCKRIVTITMDQSVSGAPYIRRQG
jgi:hypothetical protein